MAVSGDTASSPPKPQQPSSASTAKQTSHGVPVDRGWAWVVLAAACVTFGMPAGSARVTGIVYLEMLDHFGSDRPLTLWVFSLRNLITLLLGPFASTVLQKTSHRFAILVAGVLAAGGTVATGYAPVMELTFLTYSAVYGFGVAILHVASLTCTAAYFDRHRGLAVGLTTAGGGIMSFVFPQVARELFKQFSFEGALLVYGGIFMHLFICALLIRPVTSYPPTSSVEAATNENVKENLEGGVHPAAQKKLGSELSPRRQTSVPLDASVDISIADLGMSSTLHLPSPEVVTGCPRQGSSTEQPIKGKEKFGATTASKSGSIAHNFRLLKSERMWMMCIINVLASNAFMIIFTALPPYGESVGVPRQRTSTLLSIGGAAEIVCRALHGWFSDKKLISPLLQLGICSGIMGLVTLVCPIVGGELGVGLTASACGIVGTSIFTLSTVCIRELLGSENMTSAMGIKMSTQVISVVVSTFLMGYLTKSRGRWDEVFYYMGSNLIATSLFAVACYVRIKRADAQSHSNPSLQT